MSLTLLQKTRNILWGKPPDDPRERRLLFKIDCFVLTFVCLNYWVNYLSRSNFQNAYVSGMKESLKMTGDDFNKVNAIFSIGYCLGMLPNNLALLRFKPRIWLTFCSFSWGLLTLSMYKCTSTGQLCAIRFFQAVFESSTFSGTHYILGNWYREDELTKRTAVFTSSGLAGSIFSGFMQSAVHKDLNGLCGLQGYQWLFIVDFLITIPICVYGLIFFPDVPGRCGQHFFTTNERKLAETRLPPRPKTKLDRSIIRRILAKWHWWLFTLLWAISGENESYVTNSLFSLWLKFKGYTISQRNNYPCGIYAVGILVTYATAVYVDATGARYHWRVSIWITAGMLISTTLLLCKPLSAGYVFTAHYLSGVSFAGQAGFFAWVNVFCYEDREERAIILASMNMISSAVNAFWCIIFYRADSVPKFQIGCYAMIGTTLGSLIVACLIRWLQLREERARPPKLQRQEDRKE